MKQPLSPLVSGLIDTSRKLAFIYTWVAKKHIPDKFTTIECVLGEGLQNILTLGQGLVKNA